MKRIVVSYRRDDSSSEVRRLCDRLSGHFGEENVFRDVDSIAPGVDFAQRIDREIEQAGAVVAVIGPDWLEPQRPGEKRRIDDKHDFVRRELATALDRGKPLIPVTVRGATMPGMRDLPRSLAGLAHINALDVSDTDFDAGAWKLVSWLQQRVGVPKHGASTRSPRDSASEQTARRIAEASRLATLTLVFGVAGLVLPLVGWLGVRSGRRARKDLALGPERPQKLATIGLRLSWLGAILWTWFILMWPLILLLAANDNSQL